MNIGQMKNESSANGGPGNGGNGGGATSTIPSLKRTLSGGASSSAGHTIGVGPPNLASHLGAGMNSIPSVLHASSSTGPPQMLRAVTASGVYNRPGSNLSGGSGGQAGSAGRLTASGGGGATTVPTMTSRSVTQSSATTMQDWRMYLTIEERQAVRSKIRDAYSSRCMSYDDLLQVACAIEEELLHISAPSRLDYFKSGFEFENRVKLKKDQLQGQLAALDNKRGGSRTNPNTSPQPTGSSSNSPSSTHEQPTSSSTASSSSSSYNKKARS